MRFRLVLILLFACSTAFAQRTLPNPIILVHGWTGDASTWADFTNYLERDVGLTIERNSLNYNLECDGNLSTAFLYADVCDYTGTLRDRDVYVIDFQTGHSMSNQAGVVKQGYALKLAIRRVLAATGADNVMLLGHSMGGLAIREYLQNPSNWQADGQHHVAKMATIGTPHRGSDTSFGILTSLLNLGNENSEAVRDLRESYFYSNCVSGGQNIPCPGVYLWGGQESRSWMRTNALGGSNFYNIDVNCNGIVGDNVVGLNHKPISTNLDFACVIGGPNNTDGIVTTFSQNLNNVYPGLGADLFYFPCGNRGIFCHTDEPKVAFIQMLQSLDEPKKNPTSLRFGRAYRGLFTQQSSGSFIDRDDYTFVAPQRGVVTLSASSHLPSDARISVIDPQGYTILTQEVGNGMTRPLTLSSSGRYTISVVGNSLGGWATYNVALDFCPLPSLPTLTAAAPTTFCEGESVLLSTTSGYDSYRWFKDGVQITTAGNQLGVNQTGTYTVQAAKCGVSTSSTNSISTVAKPAPPKPSIRVEELPDQFRLTSSQPNNNQWFLNGNAINGATQPAHTPEVLGNYTVRVSLEGCSSSSDVAVVKMNTPTLSLSGSSEFCEGGSSTLVAPSGFGSYVFSDGVSEVVTKENTLTVKKTGKYAVKTIRGKFISEPSAVVTIKVNPIPSKPTITIERYGLSSSSLTNNQWLLNGIEIKDSTGQFLRGIGAGAYTVRVTVNGCSAESEVMLITGTDPYSANSSTILYPNPNRGFFWVELPKDQGSIQIDIFDIQGRLIYSDTEVKPNIPRRWLEISGGSDIHLLRITSEKSTQTIKFLIER